MLKIGIDAKLGRSIVIHCDKSTDKLMRTSLQIEQMSASELRMIISEEIEATLRILIPQLIDTRNKEDPMNDFVTIAEACMLLRKSKPSIYRLLRAGVLTPHRIPGTKSLLLSKAEMISQLKFKPRLI